MIMMNTKRLDGYKQAKHKTHKSQTKTQHKNWCLSRHEIWPFGDVVTSLLLAELMIRVTVREKFRVRDRNINDQIGVLLCIGLVAYWCRSNLWSSLLKNVKIRKIS